MFETLYRYSRVLARHLDAPAAEERDRFVAHFAASGAAIGSVSHLASELLVVAQLLDVSGSRVVTPEEIASAADRWVRHQRRRGRISTARCRSEPDPLNDERRRCHTWRRSCSCS